MNQTLRVIFRDDNFLHDMSNRHKINESGLRSLTHLIERIKL